MKPEELARRLNITSSAIRKWTGVDFRDFFSPSAVGVKGARRSFSEQDARILAWIAQLKEQNTPASEITTILRNAQEDNWRDLPLLPSADGEDIALVPREAVEERVRALEDRFRQEVASLQKERDQLVAQVSELKEENTELRRQIVAINNRLLSLLEEWSRK